jgi:hypothetical protein
MLCPFLLVKSIAFCQTTFLPLLDIKTTITTRSWILAIFQTFKLQSMWKRGTKQLPFLILSINTLTKEIPRGIFWAKKISSNKVQSYKTFRRLNKRLNFSKIEPWMKSLFCILNQHNKAIEPIHNDTLIICQELSNWPHPYSLMLYLILYWCNKLRYYHSAILME